MQHQAFRTPLGQECLTGFLNTDSIPKALIQTKNTKNKKIKGPHFKSSTIKGPHFPQELKNTFLPSMANK